MYAVRVANSAAPGIDSLVHRADSEAVPGRAHLRFAGVNRYASLLSRTPCAERAKSARVDVRQPFIVELHLQVDDLLDLPEEPGIDSVSWCTSSSVNPSRRIAHVPDALRARFARSFLFFRGRSFSD